MTFSDSPASSSSSSSPVHAASLVDPATHSPALLELVEVQLSRPVIDYIVDVVSEAVDYAMGRPLSPRGRSFNRSSTHTKFARFVSMVLSRAEVTAATALTSLVYVARARPHLSIALEEWALERVFLGALIVASKYTQDSTLKNVHWAMCTGVFGQGDIGRIEREFLEVLDWELGVSEADVLAHHEGVTRALGVRRHTRSKVAEPRQLRVVPAAARHTSVPELQPSSPASSSLASLSPRTPHSVDHPVAVFAQKADVPMDVDGYHDKSTTDGLLRPFPIAVGAA